MKPRGRRRTSPAGTRSAGGGITSLRGRMAVAMIASAAIVLPAVLLALFYIRRMNDAVTRIVGVDIELMHIGDRMSSDFAGARHDEKNFLLFGDTTYLARSREAMDRVVGLADSGRKLEPDAAAGFDEVIRLATRYRELLDSLASVVTLPQEPSPQTLRLSRLRRSHELLLERAASAADSTRRDSLLTEAARLAETLAAATPATRQLEDTLHLLQQQVVVHSQELVARARTRVDRHGEDARRLANWGQRNIVTVLLLTAIALIWLLAVLPRRAVLPIKRIANALRRAEEGDLDVRVKLDSEDELGALARQLNRSFARLREFDERKVERILQLERRFKLLINDISEGVIIVDRTPTILLANQAVEELLGRPVADAQGRRPQSCPGLAFIIEPLERTLAGSTAHQTCDVMPGLPGSAVCIEALRDRAGEIVGALIVISNPRPPEPEHSAPEEPVVPPAEEDAGTELKETDG